MTSLEQRYSLYHNNDFRDNDDPIDNISNAGVDNVFAESSNSMRVTYFNNACDDGGVGHSKISSFQHEDECEDDIPVNNRDSRSIPLMAGSRRKIDPSQVLLQFCLQTWLLQTFLAVLTQMILAWVSYSLRRIS